MKLGDLDAFGRVQHWKAIISPLAGYGNDNHFPAGVWRSFVMEMLEPLRIVRGVQSISFKAITEVENEGFTTGFFSKDTDMPSLNLQEALRRLVTGESAIEIVMDMWGPLFSYPQAFERCTPFRADRGLKRSETIQTTNAV
ncbi:hypothetical protein DL95DRAFT_459319 [Leptodontidium sp. 2 PMI_412]|nr:hypothetical protein DL95DRAFT_459319 [Leptodontidium sp. 2 PMI_412]